MTTREDYVLQRNNKTIDINTIYQFFLQNSETNKSFNQFQLELLLWQKVTVQAMSLIVNALDTHFKLIVLTKDNKFIKAW